MDIFNKLETIIISQGTTGTSAAEILAELGTPSVSISVLDHGSIVSKCISTVGDNSETLFQACSISKPIAGMATMKLVQQGKLHLDDKIVNLLPKHVVEALDTPQTRVLLRQVTIKHLMSHTSGFSVGGFPGYSNQAPNAELVLSGKAPANTIHVHLEGLPGYSFSYSGGGITVLQMILQILTGKDFPSLVQELVLGPLGMTRSFYTLPEGESNIATAHFTGYTPCDSKWHTQPEQAAAGLWTTPTDLLKAVRAMQQSVKRGSKYRFLEQEIAKEMLSEISNGMALTWMAPRDSGISFRHQGSNNPGWQCIVLGYADLNLHNSKTNCLIPDENGWEENGICIMTNSAAGVAAYSKIFHAISYLLQWEEIPDLTNSSTISNVPFCGYDAEVNEDWVGWRGSWVEGKNKFVLGGDAEGNPTLSLGVMKVKLIPAVIPRTKYEGEGGLSINLVLEGLEMMVRLGWKGGERTVEILRGSGSYNHLDRLGE